MTTSQQPESTSAARIPAYAWDDQVLRFICGNPKLPGQVYVRCGGEPDMAYRGGAVGSRMSLAPLTETAAPDGTDYETSSDQFILGPVQLASDAEAFAAAQRSPGIEIMASPRDARALVIVSLQPAAPSGPSAPPPIAPVVLDAEHQAHARSLAQVVEEDAIAGVHDVESEAGKAWRELKHLLRIGG